MGKSIECSSHITHVEVFARGASVTRRITIPSPLDSPSVSLCINGVSLIANPGSLKASLPNDLTHQRRVVLVRSHIDFPSNQPTPAPNTRARRELSQQIDRLDREREALLSRRSLLRNIVLHPHSATDSEPLSPTTRLTNITATQALVSKLIADIDVSIIELDQESREHKRSLKTAQVAASQSSTDQQHATGRPTRVVEVQLNGSGTPAWIDIEYAISAARWWPVYTLHITESGQTAEWWVEALIAQHTGEDWRDTHISLSTADLLYDARLPQLPSLRIGRAQPPPRTGYRELPEGLDTLFAGYDRCVLPARPSAPVLTGAPGPTAGYAGAQGLPTQAVPPSGGAHAGQVARSPQSEGLFEESSAYLRPPAMVQPSVNPGAPMPSPMVASPSNHLAPSSPSPGYATARYAPAEYGSIGGTHEHGHAHKPEPTAPPALIPSDAWNQLDTLELCGVDHRARRGTLCIPRDPTVDSERARSQSLIDALSAPRAHDPMLTRGMFDHRWTVGSLVDIPSDGRTHRVIVSRRPTSLTVRWRTVPIARPEVYREAELLNPFEAPLLTGPVDIYIDGSLLTVSDIDHVDRGGTLRVGMGVEQRIKIARNVQMSEETSGLLSGTTIARHIVSFELSSSISQPIRVEVVDRVPVSDDKSIEVTVEHGEGEPFDQLAHGQPLRGGRRWVANLSAGGKTKFDFVYRIAFSSKLELVGGNRRG